MGANVFCCIICATCASLFQPPARYMWFGFGASLFAGGALHKPYLHVNIDSECGHAHWPQPPGSSSSPWSASAWISSFRRTPTRRTCPRPPKACSRRRSWSTSPSGAATRPCGSSRRSRSSMPSRRTASTPSSTSFPNPVSCKSRAALVHPPTVLVHTTFG